MINKIMTFIGLISEKLNIRTDLILHFLVSFGISLFLGITSLSIFWIAAITLSIGIAKEVYDIFKPNATGFDLKDLLADSLGITLGCIIISLLQLII